MLHSLSSVDGSTTKVGTSLDGGLLAYLLASHQAHRAAALVVVIHWISKFLMIPKSHGSLKYIFVFDFQVSDDFKVPHGFSM